MKRITRKLVRIYHPFSITDRKWTYPAGEYDVTTEEEELGGGIYRLLKTTIYIPKSKGPTGTGKFEEIGARELESILRFPPRQKQGI